MAIFHALEALSSRITDFAARRRQRQARVEADGDTWPLLYSSPAATSGPAPAPGRIAPQFRGKVPPRTPAAVFVPPPRLDQVHARSRFARSKRFWALAALAVLFLIGGARYGLSILDRSTFADERETGLGQVAGIARSVGRWAFQLDSDQLKAEQAQQLYQPLVIKQIDPKYPDRARRAGVEGLVIVTYALDARGRPKDLKVTKSVPMLDEAVINALRQWEYTPPQKGATAHIYRYNAQFILKDLTTMASSSYDPLP